MHHKITETLSKYQNLILVGGGTGGHIQPILNIVKSLQGDNPSANPNLLWIGGKDSNESKEAEKAGIHFESISTMKLATTRSPKVLLYPFVLFRGILETRKILKRQCTDIRGSGGSGGETIGAKKSKGNRKVERGGASFLPTETFGTFGHKSTVQNDSGIAVFSKGGPGSVAIGITAWTLGIPLYIHESDTIPGRSNRVLGKIAKRIYLGFESAKKYFDPKKCDVIGQILHPIFSQGEISESHKSLISWKTKKKHMLVICGSQGAKAIFEAIVEQYGKNNPYEWIIALGKLNQDMKNNFEKIRNIQAIDWISQENIAHLLSSTDIAITRGSATTLAEIDVFRVKKIIIPLPYSAENHQYYNALEYEKKGDILLEQKNLHLLTETIEEIGQKLKLSNT